MSATRPLWLRVTAALIVFGAAPVTVFAAFWTFFWLPSPFAGIMALVVLAASAVAVSPLGRGRWDRDAFAVQGFFVVLLLLAYAVVAVVAANEAREAFASRATHATTAAQCAAWLALCAEAVILGALVVATVPVRVSRRVLVRVVGVLAVLGFGTAGAAAATAGSDSCGRFQFDRAAWQRDPVAVADALARCGTLEGLTEGQLRALLVEWPGERSWRGHTRDTLWLGDRLAVEFGDDGRVRSAKLYTPVAEPWMD
ncbi:hypothetical protein OJ997_17695 [Solirubrobacter phytolaccae]|uniref:Uncharacterized protein n=1 Tax=Solirubrobacter phytolaccae TaxID=1404360 RepID=A0A9X3N9T1_9ACTN|nr:hypothetical protein [Solirubrobacter phytolaccae]MDA0182144.1 hypothetical protein [Solirubrobacter phytolaccae]